MRQHKLTAFLCYHTSLSTLRDCGALLYSNGHPMTHSLFLGICCQDFGIRNDVVEGILVG